MVTFDRYIEADACRPGGNFEETFPGGISKPGELPCPAARSGCDFGAFDINDIYRICLNHPALEHFNKSMLRVGTNAAVVEALNVRMSVCLHICL